MILDTISSSQWHIAINQLPLGVFLLDEEGRIQGWNTWLSDRTGQTEKAVIGCRLPELFPGFNNPRFTWALEEVFSNGSAQILSQTLNHYLIPIKVDRHSQYGEGLMQQQVYVSALTAESGNTVALISILDVTESVTRSLALNSVVTNLQQLSNIDQLTGLYNRRFMLDWLDIQIKSAKRNRTVIACVMLDIDHFKRVNDSFGHLVGDTVLQGFAKAINQLLRNSDVFVRYGGEEFMLLLPGCNLSDGIKYAQKINNTVREAAIEPLDAGKVTCSIGVSVYEPDQDISIEKLLKEADDRLYDAKRNGRDRVLPELNTQ